MIDHLSDLFKIPEKPEFGNKEHIDALKRISELKKNGCIEMNYFDRVRQYEVLENGILIKNFCTLGRGVIDKAGCAYEWGDGLFKENHWEDIDPDIICRSFEWRDDHKEAFIHNDDLWQNGLVLTEPKPKEPAVN